MCRRHRRALIVVMGLCAYYAFYGATAAAVDAALANREHPLFTEAARFARHAAQARLHRAAEASGADGATGITLDRSLHAGSVTGQAVGGPGDRICLCMAVGTAVRRTPAGPRPTRPAGVLPLRNPPL